MEEIIYSIPKSRMDLLLNKIIKLDELKVNYHPDTEAMRQEAIEILRNGINDIRKYLSDFESDEQS